MTGEDAAGRVIRTLVVEDEKLTAEAHASYLRRLSGFDVAGIVHTGAQAILALRAAREGDPIDLVLLDMNLPDMSGLDLCRSMRAAGVEVDVIAVTARRDMAAVRSAVSLGIVQYVIKPFAFATFAAKMRAYQAYYASIAHNSERDQAQLDETFASLHTARAPMPKGISAETLAIVRSALTGVGDETWLSAEEVAQSALLSRATARRYLEHLVAAGATDRRSRYGSPGRPEMEYRLKDSQS